MAHDGGGGADGDPTGGRREGDGGGALAMQRKKRALAERQRLEAEAEASAPAPTPTPAPAPTPAPTPEPVPTPVSKALLGAINRSAGDTGTAALNQGAVTRARQVGTPIGKLVSSIDGSRPRSQLGGIVKKAGDLTSTKVIDTSGL